MDINSIELLGEILKDKIRIRFLHLDFVKLKIYLNSLFINDL